MKISKCSCCVQLQNIVYQDYCSGKREPVVAPIYINLCWDCLDDLGWKFEMQKILPQVLSCNVCKKRYIPSRVDQVICTICWLKKSNLFKQEEKVIAPFCF